MCFCLIQYINLSHMNLFNKLLVAGKYHKSYWQIDSSGPALRTLFNLCTYVGQKLVRYCACMQCGPWKVVATIAVSAIADLFFSFAKWNQ